MQTKLTLKDIKSDRSFNIIEASHPTLGNRWLYCQEATEVLFTDNETNYQRLFGSPNTSTYIKDGINNYIVNGQKSAVNSVDTPRAEATGILKTSLS